MSHITLINQWNFVIKKKKLQLHVVVLVRHINTYTGILLESK